MIYTLCRTDDNNEKVLKFIKHNTSKITDVTMWWDRRFGENFKNSIQALGLKVFVHTVNDSETVNKFIKQDVGVYTDFYPEAD
jgi:glycerophosphoryl diester phosphodiesterase